MKRRRGERRRGWEVLCPTLHDTRRLAALQQSLESFLAGAEDDTVTKTARRPGRWVGLAAAPALGLAVRDYMLRRSFTLREFIAQVLLPTLKAALNFTTLFAAAAAEPSGDADHGTRCCSVAVNQPSATFTRRQVWCLLGNMFFCAFRSRTEAGADFSTDEDEADGHSNDGARGAAGVEWVDAGLLPTTDYREIHTAPEGSNSVEVAKLLLLFTFFAEAQTWTAEEYGEPGMTAHRTRAATSVAQTLVPKAWRCASSHPALPPLQPVVLHKLGESIDDQEEMIRVDFANRWVGGGALSAGAVQEEVTFAQCPALNVLRWFHGRLGHTESLVVTHYTQYGRVEAGTYGSTLRFGAAVSPPRLCRGALLVVDALDFRYDAVEESSAAAVYRELVKLVGGLACPALMSLPDVAGGNWGCGVFGGDYELKFLIQWAACGTAGKTLHYFPFDNDAFAAFVPHVARRLRGGCVPPLTTAALLSFLYALEEASDEEEEGEETQGGERAFGFVWKAFLRHFCPVETA